MSIIQLVRCERYDNCKKEFTIPGLGHVIETPDTWFTLTVGNPLVEDSLHFCSELCLARWIAMRGVVMPIPEPQGKTEGKRHSKARLLKII